MKNCVKKRMLMPILALIIALQPTGLYSNIFKESSFLAGYFFGTGIGACAFAGSSLIIEPLRKMFFQRQQAYLNASPKTKSNMHLNGYIGAIPQEVADLIEQLKNPEDFLKMKVKLTKGLIFFGPPGSGKTQLARAIASEVRCPFFAANATDFKKQFIGEGKDAVVELFEKARNAARQHHSRTAILFIDEFDAVDKRVGGVHDAGRSEVINALLNEMDGFNRHEDIRLVVIAATNFLKAIDSALRRSGRFDYKVYIPYPDMQGRALFIEQFLQIYPTDPTISHDELSKITEGMSPADMVFLFELAGRIAVRSKKNVRDMICFKEALNEINT